MKRHVVLFLMILLAAACHPNAKDASRRQETLLTQWEFSRDSLVWQAVTVPHDWAIEGPFDRANDLQAVQVTQNFETAVTEHTGRTGGLPYVGKGWYRTHFDVADYYAGRDAVTLLFDGAMSQARVRVNGHPVIEWPYGYNAFHADVTAYLTPDGKDNLLEVSLENLPHSSRWYPGAGLYRNVHLIRTHAVHIPVWGTRVTTPEVSEKEATVLLEIEVSDPDPGVRVRTRILGPQGDVKALSDTPAAAKLQQQFRIMEPQRWSPETPDLYRAVTQVYDAEGAVLDEYTTRFGIRTLELVPDKGFYLNGQVRKIQGVCNHHDLGPLGGTSSPC